MTRVCVLSSIVGACYFIFGTLCLAAPFFCKCDYSGGSAGLFNLDQIGVFAAFIGAIVYGASMIALAIASKAAKQG